jgi:4-hydroxy-3-polyprenylbenzoate decarboxylase
MEKYHARGQDCPIAITLGQDPSVFLGSMTPLPGAQSEYDYAGWVRGRPVEVIEGPISGLPLPARAEVVLEGEIPPPDRWPALPEGPFGEWPGYYTERSESGCAVMNVRAVYHREDPINHGSPPMAPPAVHLLAVPISAATLWDQLELAGIPGITGVWGHISSGQAGFFTVISIRQMYAGHAKQVGLVATGARAGAYGGRFTVIVDEDIDISNPREVIWAMATRCDPGQHIDIVRDVWTTIVDPIMPPEKRAQRNLVSDRAIVLAVRPYLWKEQFPAVCSFSKADKAAVKERWKL